MAFVGKLPPLKKVIAEATAITPATAPSQDALVGAWTQYMGITPQPISDAALRALNKES